jgi:ABC-type transporter Mla subunit MlaD
MLLEMADKRIEKIKAAVEAADHIPAEKKAKLAGLIATLDPAIAKFAETNQQHAQHITGLVEQSAHAASRKNREHLNKILQQLKESVQRLEASHPDLAFFVTEYSAFLSALGI